MGAPTHLKLDVDGSELSALQGAERIMDGVRSVMVELDVEDGEPITELLTAAGLTEVTHFERRKKKGVLVPHWYALFARPSASATESS